MKKIELKSLTLKNFKGIKDLTISFNGITNISGQNATGKTSINDAFRFLMFDKDSSDRKNFSIKPLDKFNEVIHGLETSVIGTLLINGKEKTFQKTFKEKWQKQRGESDKVFTGNETLYYVNEVPVKQSDYQKEISSIIDETLFKLITDPLYFSSTMKWQDRRTMLMRMFNHVSVADVIASDKALMELEPELVENTIQQLKDKYKSQKKKLNDDIKSIPFRIDECNNSIREIDSVSLKKKLTLNENHLREIDQILLSYSRNDENFNQLRNDLNSIRSEIDSIEREHENKLYDQKREIDKNLSRIENEIRDLRTSVGYANSRADRIRKDKEGYDKTVNDLVKQWQEEKIKEFHLSEDFICPTCKRPLDESTIENKKNQLLENFNQDKAARLEQINRRGKEVRAQSDAIVKELSESEQLKEDLIKKLSSLELQLETAQKEKSAFEIAKSKTLTRAFDFGTRYFQLKDEYEKIEQRLSLPADSQTKTNELTAEKRDLQKDNDSIKVLLHQEDTNTKQRSRIKELEEQERKLSQSLADIEKKEFLCEKYIKTEVELLESSINAKFKFVRFKLFNVLINGAIDECCEPLVDGVPFMDANNAAKINSGIDIINALSEYHDVSAPIIIDNREGINEIIPTSAQLVNLIVTRDKELRVS